MNLKAHLPLRSENAGAVGSTAATGALLLLIGLIPHTERALLSTDGQLQAKAFAAAVAPLDTKQSQLEAGLLNRFAGHRPHHIGKTARPAGSAFVTPGRTLLADAVPSTFPNPSANAPAFQAPPSTVPGSTDNFSSGDTSTSGGSGPSLIDPLGAAPALGAATPGGTTSGGTTSGGAGGTTSGGAGGTTSGGTGGTTSGGTGGTTSGGTGGTTSGGTGGTTSAVPEPSTWLTMLCGFFVVGASLRRRPRQKQTASLA